MTDLYGPPAPPAATAGNDPAGREQRVLEALADPVARALLLALSDRPRSAPELVMHLRLPHSSLYRKLHELRELGLVAIHQAWVNAQGKRVETFLSLVTQVRVEMKGGGLHVEVCYRDLARERARTMWDAMRKEAGR